VSHNPVEVERRIRERVAVDAQLLLLAKLHLTEHCASELESQLTAFAVSLGARLAQPVVIHPSTDVEVAIATTARYLSAQIAIGEAVWALIAAGILVPRSEDNNKPRLHAQTSICWR
jgi:hypothetical protein